MSSIASLAFKFLVTPSVLVISQNETSEDKISKEKKISFEGRDFFDSVSEKV